jgi:hypothetical protein
VAVRDGSGWALARPNLGCMPVSWLHDGENRTARLRWHWAMGARRNCIVASRALGMDVCCVSWSDAFYLPAREASEFISILPVVAKLPNEAALPTMLHFVAQRWSGGAKRVVRCAGSCCSSVSWRDALQARCGHRVNLAARAPEQVRAACKRWRAASGGNNTRGLEIRVRRSVRPRTAEATTYVCKRGHAWTDGWCFNRWSRLTAAATADIPAA